MPTCHLPPPLCPQCAAEASRAWWGKKDDDRVKCYYVQKNYASLTVPCPTLSPSLPHLTFSLSLCLLPPVLLLPTSSLYISVLSLSFTLPIFTFTLSVFLSLFLSVVLFFILFPLSLYSGGTWRPRASVKNNCQYVCVCVRSCTHACSPARALAICSHSIRFA